MAINAIEVYPTCEIHLLRGMPTTMSVIVREAGELNEKNLLKEDDCVVTTLDFNTNLINVDIDQQAGCINFSPNPNTIAIDNTIGRIRNTHQGVVTEVLVRVFVHDQIDQYWIGNNEVTIHEGADNYVLSVYAKFSDKLTAVDISSHPYINFSSTDPTKVDIDNNLDKGRITGVAPTSNNPVQLQAQIGAEPIREVDAYVIEPIDTPKPILKCILGSTEVDKRENILFIAEGFTATQKNVFEAMAHNITNRLFNGKENSPFHLLKDKFNVWVAFEPSPQNGASILRPVSPSSGNLFPLDTGNDPFQFPDHVLVQARNNRHGLAYGFRYGDQASKEVDNPSKRDQWFIPHGSTRTFLQFDRKRLPRHWNTFEVVDDYLDKLKVDPSLHSPAKYAQLTDIWKSSGKNRGLVCWLVDGDLSGAAVKGGDAYGIKVLAKKRLAFDISPFPVLPEILIFNQVPFPLSLFHTAAGMPVIKGTNMPAVTSTIVHELGHGFGLGDAYETGPTTKLLQGDASSQEQIELHTNLTHFWRVGHSNSKIDLDKVVWNQWHRVSIGAMLLTKAANVGNNTIQFDISVTEASLWFSNFTQPNQQVFLRTRDINFDNDNSGNNHKYVEGPFTLHNIDTNTGKIQLKGSINKNFPPGSVLYLPKEIDNQPISLIHPKVIAFFNDPQGNNQEAFAKKDEAKNECDTPNISGSSAPVIPDFSVTNQQYIVGVYEGGGYHSCNVYRPSGQCKMRKTGLDMIVKYLNYPAFCAVCKYHLVNKIDPGKLGEVDKEYPS